VKGLPVFYLVNDSLQIHRAFRGEADRVAMTVIFIPRHLLFTKKITLIANTGIDVQYDNSDRDYTITDFIKIRGEIRIDLESLRVRGIDLYEMYTPDLPWNIRHAKQLGIEQELFLMDVRNVDTNSKIFRDVFRDTKMLKSHDDFLHGFFGDQNIFGRRPSEYLPKNVYSIKIT